MDDQVIGDRILQLLRKAARSVPGGKPLSEKNITDSVQQIQPAATGTDVQRCLLELVKEGKAIVSSVGQHGFHGGEKTTQVNYRIGRD
jgi:hypothetical protein